jgi:hypothetical protein
MRECRGPSMMTILEKEYLLNMLEKEEMTILEKEYLLNMSTSSLMRECRGPSMMTILEKEYQLNMLEKEELVFLEGDDSAVPFSKWVLDFHCGGR